MCIFVLMVVITFVRVRREGREREKEKTERQSSSILFVLHLIPLLITKCYAAFDEFFQKYRWYNTGIKFWEGEFMKPLGDSWYNETTPYGTFRTFNNGKTEWHNATDMAVGGGTPIYATNSGVVLFSDYLGLTGNTVIINHGMGVLSWHYHLSSRKVSVGDKVEKGDFIGRVGTTGLSTGNHLHFGITVGGIFVDPMQMIGSEPDIDFWKESIE